MDNKLKIINYLGKNLEKRFTMHELSIALNIPYASFYRTIQGLRDIVATEAIGRSKVICLKKDNPIVKAYLTISSDEERKEFLANKPILKKIATELETDDIVVLFGSYAKGKETEKSDIDLLIINKDGKKSLTFSKYELLFKKRINPVFITHKELRDMLKDKEENVGKQALKAHILLSGQEAFWGLVLDGI
jgi:predicted nucleotidyltransferase